MQRDSVLHTTSLLKALGHCVSLSRTMRLPVHRTHLGCLPGCLAA